VNAFGGDVVEARDVAGGGIADGDGGVEPARDVGEDVAEVDAVGELMGVGHGERDEVVKGHDDL